MSAAVFRGPRAALQAWFESRGWQAHGFQQEVWEAMTEGQSGLLHATTGAGKTLAVWGGALLRGLAAGAGAAGARTAPPLGVLWLTPMRALAADTLLALQAPLSALAPGWTCGLRTGDTPSAERARQDRRWPTTLVTTPESLCLMLTRARASEELASVHTVIVDEWHELLGSKRGVQVQLALARLRRLNPGLVVWGLSATLGNLEEAMATLTHPAPARLVRGRLDKSLVIDTLLPAEPGRFTWAGHLGASMQAAVVREIEAQPGTTLVFTNVRSQAEAWYQLLLDARPDWAGLVALHHGSLERGVREWVEQGLKDGRLKAVVATSSLDLGVDFLPVERVLQIGSPKGIARLLQRAGRSGHAPGRPSRVTLVPTHTFELVEAAGARRAVAAGRVECRRSPQAPMDVLVQHLVTLALGGGFEADASGPGGQPGAAALLQELRQAWAYRQLTPDAFAWALAFASRGGESLAAYPEHHKLQVVEGRWQVPDAGIARRHRLQVGTIVADAAMKVAWLHGGTLGTVEESFIARLSPGDAFVFAGRVLEFVRSRELTAYVRAAKSPKGRVVVWSGSRMSLSSEMADAALSLVHEAAQGRFDEPELVAAQPMLQAQARLSALPLPGEVLVETWRSREGHHLFLHAFAGRSAHLGLGGLLAWRLGRDRPNTFSIAVNDYGLELLSAEPVVLDALWRGELLEEGTPQALLDDVLASLNASELAQRRFREIARVAGLVFTGFPGAGKGVRQLQASASLFYEVFRQHDAGNRLLTQAQAEVLSQELEVERLRQTLATLRASRLRAVALQAPSPLALPLMVERLRERLSTEKLADRLRRMLDQADQALDAEAAPPVPRRRRRA
ncbi:ligase-associated DNA damage response DEXH box helicase [Ideonella livida]|uniref:ligase-associated DNA damage response DEXH box helicase n=1 Tax=Ideonella livida TaxID=2707176 RepID=UPI00287305E1|nr:ligase-associated DNA damage response DEXH box helicase [Ideonella livida]